MKYETKEEALKHVDSRTAVAAKQSHMIDCLYSVGLKVSQTNSFKEITMKKLSWKNGNECHYGETTVVISNNVDLKTDYDYPRSHIAMHRSGKTIRVIIDHDATGTATTGTGDTVGRSIPRGWAAGSRQFAG